MTVRDLSYETGWITLAGLLVSFHRLAMGFYLSDPGATGWHSIALVGLGGLSAVVLTGTQMILAATLARVQDRMLEIAWWVLLICAVIVMSASTLASMHREPLADVMMPEWLAARPPAVVLAIGLSLAIEISLASLRRASVLLEASVDSSDVLHLAPHELAELEVQRELARHDPDQTQAVSLASESGEAATDDRGASGSSHKGRRDTEQFTEGCPWCAWTATATTRRSAINSVNAHQRFCEHRPD